MKRLFNVAVMAAMGVAAMSTEAGDSFRWNLNGTGRTERREVACAPESGTYSVRFRAALVNAKGGNFRVLADGVAFQSHGDGFYLDGSSVQQLVPGQADEINFDFSLRNRCYHDFVFVCTGGEVCLFGDGDEKRPVLRKPGAKRGFSMVAENIDLDVLGFEVAEGDMRGKWTCRNQLINGGFETLNNGYPIAWGTYNFGFGSPKEIIDLENVRARYRPDDTTAWEGKRSFYLASGCPLWECWRPRVPCVDYVFSAYVKGDCPGARVTMLAMGGYRPITQQVFSVGTGWTRLELPFRSLKGTLRVGFAKWHGNVWIDGVQLERGTKATEFVARPVPTMDLPPDPPKVMDHYYTDKTKPLPPSGAKPRMACLDPKRNSFMFDGKEFFLYGFSNPGFGDVKSYAAMMELYAKWGLNFISMGPGSFPKDPNTLRQYLDAGVRNGVKALIYISHRGEGKNLHLDPEQLAVLKSVGAHPGLCCVDILDEMYGRATPEQRQRFADEIRAATAGKVPVQFNEFDLGVISHMDYSAADIASGDFYVPGQQEISAQYYVLKQLRDEHPDQVVSYYPFASGHFTNTWLRDATPDEIIAQAYIGYSLEVFNIKWWQGVPLTQPALDAVLQAKRERDLIDPSAFLDGETVGVKCESRNDAVKFAARRMKNGVTRIIAVNIENRPNTAKWTLPSKPKSVKALIGNKPGKTSGAAIEDAFGPLERRVYDICL